MLGNVLQADFLPIGLVPKVVQQLGERFFGMVPMQDETEVFAAQAAVVAGATAHHLQPPYRQTPFQVMSPVEIQGGEAGQLAGLVDGHNVQTILIPPEDVPPDLHPVPGQEQGVAVAVRKQLLPFRARLPKPRFTPDFAVHPCRQWFSQADRVRPDGPSFRYGLPDR